MKRLVTALSAFAFGLSLNIAAALTAAAAPAPQVVTITASASSLFSPSQITVHTGQPVELKFIGQGGVHAVQSDELGIANTMITPGSTKTLTFTPSKPGTYTLQCAIPCGPDHAKMSLVIEVV